MNYMGFLLGYAKISCLLVKSLKKEQRRSVNRVLENTAKSYHQFEIKKFFNDKANVKKHPGHVYPGMMGSLLGLSRLLHFSESSMEIAKIAHFGHRTLCELKRCSVHVPPELKERIERLGSYASFFGATKKPNWASLFFSWLLPMAGNLALPGMNYYTNILAQQVETNCSSKFRVQMVDWPYSPQLVSNPSKFSYKKNLRIFEDHYGHRLYSCQRVPAAGSDIFKQNTVFKNKRNMYLSRSLAVTEKGDLIQLRISKIIKFPQHIN